MVNPNPVIRSIGDALDLLFVGVDEARAAEVVASLERANGRPIAHASTNGESASDVVRARLPRLVLVGPDTVDLSFLETVQRESPSTRCKVLARYEDLPRLLQHGVGTRVGSVLSATAPLASIARVLDRDLRAAADSLPPGHSLAPSMSIPPETHTTGTPPLSAEMRKTVRVAAKIPRLAIRTFTPDETLPRIEFVAPRGNAFDRFVAALPQIWGAPLSGGGTDHPLLDALGEMPENGAVYVARQDGATAWPFVAILPWSREAKATVIVGTFCEGERPDFHEELRACHALLAAETAEHFLPPTSAPDGKHAQYVPEYEWVVATGYAGPDRRKPASPFAWRMLTGQRKHLPSLLRELSGGFVDNLPPFVKVFAVAYAVLAVIDTVLTWRCVSQGIVAELNPMLRPLIGRHFVGFLVVKMIPTVIAFLVVARFHLFKIGRALLPVLVLAYFALDVYWAVLLLRQT